MRIWFPFLFAASLLPCSVTSQWVHMNSPAGGAVICFAIDTSAAGGPVLFAGTLASGVLRSTDGGSTWNAANTGLTSRRIFHMDACGTHVFAGTDDAGIFVSTDLGDTWKACNSGLKRTCIYALGISPIRSGTGGPTVFISDLDGVHVSFDGGGNWTSTNSGLPPPFDVVSVFAFNGSNVFAGTGGGGVYLSTNNGAKWTAMNTGLPMSSHWFEVNDLIYKNPDLFVATTGGVFCHSNNATSWNSVSSGLTSKEVYRLGSLGPYLFASTLEGGVFRSMNGGESWSPVGGGLTGSAASDFITYPVPGQPGRLLFFAANSAGIFLTTNAGESWNSVPTGLANHYIATLVNGQLSNAAGGPNLFAGTSLRVYRSTDHGTNWLSIGKNENLDFVNTLYADEAGLYAASYMEVFISTDNGVNWKSANAGLPEGWIMTLCATGQFLFVGTDSKGVFRSTKDGTNWIAVNNGLTDLRINALTVTSDLGITRIFAGTYMSGAFLSTDNGSSWTPVNNGLGGKTVTSLAVCKNPDSSGGAFIIAGTGGQGIYYTSDYGKNWNWIYYSGMEYDIVTLISVPNAIHSGGAAFFAVPRWGGAYPCVYNGSMWSLKYTNDGLSKINVETLTMDSLFVYAGTYDRGIWRRPLSDYTLTPPPAPTLISPADSSTVLQNNLTLKWSPVSDVSNYYLQISRNSSFSSVVYSNYYQGIQTSNQFNSLLYGTKYYWRVRAVNSVGNGPYSKTGFFITAKAPPPSPKLAQPGDGAINLAINPTLKWRPSANAASYHLQISPLQTFSEWVFNDSTLADTLKQVSGLSNNIIYYWRVRAKDTGGSSAFSSPWSFTTIVALPEAPVLAVPGNGAAGLVVNPVLCWRSSANTASYLLQVAGDSSFTMVVFQDSTLADTSKQVPVLDCETRYFWRVRAKNKDGVSPFSLIRSFTTGTTGVWESLEKKIPAEFRLAQNYPNPFNPLTTICYSLPSPSEIRLVVYDLEGREKAVLAEGRQDAGAHRVTFDGTRMNSGIYFYKLEADSKILTRKMILLK